MKIDSNITVYAGARPEGGLDTAAGLNGEEKAQEKRKTIFAGNLNPDQESPLRDRIAEKKAKAQEKAMKLVGEALAAELKVDGGMEASRQHVKELQEQRVELQNGMENIDRRQEVLDAARENGEIGEEAYQEDAEALRQERLVQEQELARNQGQVMGENASIRGTRLERLKHQPMVEAWDDADGIMKAANDEIVNMAMQEGVEHVDEETEKREEQAEEIKEEKEEKEKLLEKQKEKREEEAWIEDLSPEEISDLTKSTGDVQREVQDMLRKMNLLDEDIKGAAVDESL